MVSRLGVGDDNRALEMQQVRDDGAYPLTGARRRDGHKMRLAGIKQRLSVKQPEIEPARVHHARQTPQNKAQAAFAEVRATRRLSRRNFKEVRRIRQLRHGSRLIYQAYGVRLPERYPALHRRAVLVPQ